MKDVNEMIDNALDLYKRLDEAKNRLNKLLASEVKHKVIKFLNAYNKEELFIKLVIKPVNCAESINDENDDPIYRLKLTKTFVFVGTHDENGEYHFNKHNFYYEDLDIRLCEDAKIAFLYAISEAMSDCNNATECLINRLNDAIDKFDSF